MEKNKITEEFQRQGKCICLSIECKKKKKTFAVLLFLFLCVHIQVADEAAAMFANIKKSSPSKPKGAAPKGGANADDVMAAFSALSAKKAAAAKKPAEQQQGDAPAGN